MNKFAGLAYGTLLGVVAGTALAGSASAADLPIVAAEPTPSLIDVAFGIAGVTDYRFRGITNSNKKAAVQGYAEVQVADWVYFGLWSSSVKFPGPIGTDPSSEIDIYGGIRHTFGAFSIDAGALYYWYPSENLQNGALRQTDYWELKALPSVAIGDYGSITGNIWWSADNANTGANELYLSIVPKVNIPLKAIPDVSFYVSGEFGKQWYSKTTKGPRYEANDYLTWNIGGGAVYKAMTIDVRYIDTNLKKNECAFNTGHRGYCGSTVVGKLAFDTSLNKLK